MLLKNNYPESNNLPFCFSSKSQQMLIVFMFLCHAKKENASIALLVDPGVL